MSVFVDLFTAESQTRVKALLLLPTVDFVASRFVVNCRGNNNVKVVPGMMGNTEYIRIRPTLQCKPTAVEGGGAAETFLSLIHFWTTKPSIGEGRLLGAATTMPSTAVGRSVSTPGLQVRCVQFRNLKFRTQRPGCFRSFLLGVYPSRDSTQYAALK